jgi:hypothetical protein
MPRVRITPYCRCIHCGHALYFDRGEQGWFHIHPGRAKCGTPATTAPPILFELHETLVEKSA